jgi:hypothetical protein
VVTVGWNAKFFSNILGKTDVTSSEKVAHTPFGAIHKQVMLRLFHVIQKFPIDWQKRSAVL